MTMENNAAYLRDQCHYCGEWIHYAPNGYRPNVCEHIEKEHIKLDVPDLTARRRKVRHETVEPSAKNYQCARCSRRKCTKEQVICDECHAVEP